MMREQTDQDVARELLAVARAMRDWIDAVPATAELPAMPGFDRDWADQVIEAAEHSTKRLGCKAGNANQPPFPCLMLSRTRAARA